MKKALIPLVFLTGCAAQPEIACTPNKMIELTMNSNGQISGMEFDPRPNGGCSPPAKWYNSPLVSVGGNLLSMAVGYHYGNKSLEYAIDGMVDLSGSFIRSQPSLPEQAPAGPVYNVSDSFNDSSSPQENVGNTWSPDTYLFLESFTDSRQDYGNTDTQTEALPKAEVP